MPDGGVVGEHPNPAVPPSTLREIGARLLQGATLEDVIDCLRSRTVPAGYELHTWKLGSECS